MYSHFELYLWIGLTQVDDINFGSTICAVKNTILFWNRFVWTIVKHYFNDLLTPLTLGEVALIIKAWFSNSLYGIAAGLGRVPDLRVRVQVRVLVMCVSPSPSPSTWLLHEYESESEYWLMSTSTSTSTGLWSTFYIGSRVLLFGLWQ